MRGRGEAAAAAAAVKLEVELKEEVEVEGKEEEEVGKYKWRSKCEEVCRRVSLEGGLGWGWRVEDRVGADRGRR